MTWTELRTRGRKSHSVRWMYTENRRSPVGKEEHSAVGMSSLRTRAVQGSERVPICEYTVMRIGEYKQTSMLSRVTLTP